MKLGLFSVGMSALKEIVQKSSQEPVKPLVSYTLCRTMSALLTGVQETVQYRVFFINTLQLAFFFFLPVCNLVQ